MVRIAPAAVATLTVVSALAALPSAGATGSGIRGRATASPTCAVEPIPPDPACAPRGFTARVRVYRASDRRPVKRFTTGNDGRFSVRLRPGHYELRARPASGASLPRCGRPIEATVHAGQFSHVVLDCDSGIR